MAKRGRTRVVYRNLKKRMRRRGTKNTGIKYVKKAVLGTLAGLAVAIPVSLLAKHINQPQLVEVADRGGAIAASAIGGTMGQVGYQIADGLFDRYVVYGNQRVSGGNGVYL